MTAAETSCLLRRVTQRSLQSNTWLLAAPGAGEAGSDCVVVDPGLDEERTDEALAQCGWVPRGVLCTHGHFDHIGGAARLQRAHGLPVGLPVFMPAADLKLAKMANFMLAAFKRPERISLPKFTLLDFAKATVRQAGRSFTFHPLPGHTPGSAVIAVDGLLFTGDSLYARHTGLSSLPGEDHAQLRASLRSLFAWADDSLQVLPGHGEASTLADILAHNSALRDFMAAELTTEVAAESVASQENAKPFPSFLDPLGRPDAKRQVWVRA